MSGTTVGFYLVIARYGPANWAKWKNTPVASRLEARDHALDLFPIAPPKPLPPTDTEVAHAFHTGIFTELPEDFPEKPEDEQIAILNNIFTSQRGNAPGTAEKDPSVGWVALVPANKFSTFVTRMGDRTGPLWQMYDIEVIPLNSDQDTKDIYDFMTTIHWAIPPASAS